MQFKRIMSPFDPDAPFLPNQVLFDELEKINKGDYGKRTKCCYIVIASDHISRSPERSEGVAISPFSPALLRDCFVPFAALWVLAMTP